MSYTPYPSADSSSTSATCRWGGGRIWRIVLLLLCLAPPAIFYWYRFRPIKAEEPLAKISLSGERELRLVAIQRGTRFEIRGPDDFSGRVVWDGYRYHRGTQIWNHDERAAWMIFTIYDPSQHACMAPNFGSVDVVDEEGVVFRGDTQRINGTNPGMPPISGAIFGTIPRRAELLKLRIRVGGELVEANWPNPFRTADAPVFPAKPLPQMEIVDGAEIRLNSVSLRERPLTEMAGINYDVRVNLAAKLNGMDQYPLETSYALFDSTGNESTRSTLPMGDRVWGIRVTAQEPLNFPFPKHRRLTLARLPIPGPQQAMKVQLPQKLIADGLVDMFVLGPGAFRWNNGRLLKMDASGRTTELGKVAITSPGNWTSDALTVLMVEGSDSSRPGDGRSLLVRAKGEVITHTNSTGITSSDCTARLFSRYRSANHRAPQPGEELEVEMVFPKARTATFYFERPSVPAPELKRP